MMNRGIRQLTYCAIFVALNVVCGIIAIPFGSISLTLQTLCIYLSLYYLGPLYGSVSVLAYILLGVIGLPVFSSSGGLLGPSGGFIIGFIPLMAVYSLVLLLFGSGKLSRILATALSLIALYASGSVYYALVYLGGIGQLWASMLVTVIPFVLPDIAKIALAFLLSERLLKYKNK